MLKLLFVLVLLSSTLAAEDIPILGIIPSDPLMGSIRATGALPDPQQMAADIVGRRSSRVDPRGGPLHPQGGQGGVSGARRRRCFH